MKDGFVISDDENISDEDIKQINKFTKRILKKSEVYVFSMVLCDNEVDREYEKFTVKSLEKLSSLFVGKTGILDHDAKAEKQLARIFSCRIENLKTKNSVGENYCRLVAKAYIPRTKNTEDFIMQIDSGIKKEVSVRCLMGKNLCCICGDNINLCEHKKGKIYSVGNQKVLCHSILENPIDAYEWSFVAVPTQVSAGVIKESSNGKLQNELEIIDKIKLESSKKGNKNFEKLIKNLEDKVKIGQNYIDEMKDEVFKFLSFAEPQIERKVIKKMTDSLDFDELKNFRKVIKSKNLPFYSQFVNENEQISQKKISEFKI